MNLLFGHDEAVAEWVQKKYSYRIQYQNTCVGVIDRNGLLVGAGVFQCLSGANVEFSYYGHGSATALVVRGLMRLAFDGMKVCRVTARTARHNKRVIRALPRFGFKMEGVMRHYYGPRKKLDAIVFGLLATDARRIIGEKK